MEIIHTAPADDQASRQPATEAVLKMKDVEAIFSAKSSYAFPTMLTAKHSDTCSEGFGVVIVGGTGLKTHMLPVAFLRQAELRHAALIRGSKQRTTDSSNGPNESAPAVCHAIQAERRAVNTHRFMPAVGQAATQRTNRRPWPLAKFAFYENNN